MIETIESLKKQLISESSFISNVLILMTGTTISQAIPIIISPVLTRIYTPKDFGVFALYLGIVSILSVLATGKYELAVILPEKDEDAISLVALCVFVAFIVSSISFLLIYSFKEIIIKCIGNSAISIWLFLVPYTVLVSGFYITFNYWSNRKKKYKIIAISKIVQSITSAGISLIMGFKGIGAGGLILSGICGQSLATGLLGWQVWKAKENRVKLLTSENMVTEAKKYSDFPKYSIPADFISVVSSQMPIFFISNLFNGNILGFYSLTQRVLGTPIGFIASSILDVFKQRASNDYIMYGNCKDIYVKTLKSLIFFTVIPFVLFFLMAPDIFGIVFGSEWRIAGEYAQIMSIMYALKFVSSPLSYMYYIAEKQKEDFLLHIYIGVSTLLSLSIGYYIFNDVRSCLILFSTNYSVVYLICILRSYHFSKGVRI